MVALATRIWGCAPGSHGCTARTVGEQVALGDAAERDAAVFAHEIHEFSVVAGEQEARRELFAGAIGTIKNPTSHRDVRYDDPTEASEAILLADLLMRILNRIDTRNG